MFTARQQRRLAIPGLETNKNMRLLVTGNKGFLGTHLEPALIKNRIDVVGIDIAEGGDLLDLECVETKAKRCDGIVHLAAYKNTNPKLNEISGGVLAYMNLLKTAIKFGIREILNISSVDAIGVFKGERGPDYFPIDEEHACRPSTDYGIAKKICEDIGTYYSMAHQLSITSLRPPGIWEEATYDVIKRKREENPEYEWKPFWEYGAFIDVRDLISLMVLIINGKREIGQRIYNVCADNITTSGKSGRELAKMIHPDVVWKNIDEYQKNPYKAILRNDKVKHDYNWAPIFNWKI